MSMIDTIIKKLEGADPEKPWKTANSLAKLFDGISAEQVEHLLILYYTENKNPQIRYSSLPSKKTLEVLWGHLDHVRSRNLEPLTLREGVERLELESDDFASPEVFLSHSHKDFLQVKKLAEHLVDKSENEGVGLWIAEVDILKGDLINHRIIRGLNKCHTLLFYLSQNSIHSKWSCKELEQAIRKIKDIVIVIDEKFTSLEGFLNQKSELISKLTNYSNVDYFWNSPESKVYCYSGIQVHPFSDLKAHLVLKSEENKS